MPQLWQLADVLVECRVVSRARWDRAAEAGELPEILDAIAAEPPDWWDRVPPAPSGLTDYQRWVIEGRFAADDLALLRRDLALNQFLLLDKLGQGGQGEVYRGRQLNPPRFVALKTLIRDTEVGRRRFEQEAKAMMTIRHPAVARFHLYERVRDAGGEPTDEYVIAMELVGGIDLNRLVRRGGPVPWPFAAHWVADLLGGLAVIHKSGFIHRDVKPENVMIVGPTPDDGVTPDQTAAKLLDFGAVKQADTGREARPGSGVFVGTREYAPPEQWTGDVVAASDLYALGGTLFFALTGRTTFQLPRRDPVAYMNAHLNDPAPDLREYNPDVPEAANDLFQKMMAKDPADRGTAEKLIHEFRRLIPRPGGAKPPSPTPPPVRPKTAPAPATRITAAREHEPHGLFYRIADRILGMLERGFIPGHLRPQPGHEPSVAERVMALLRRPMVLILLLVLIVLLIVWMW
jgi:serine/threonine protein kinase